MQTQILAPGDAADEIFDSKSERTRSTKVHGYRAADRKPMDDVDAADSMERLSHRRAVMLITRHALTRNQQCWYPGFSD